MKQGWIKLHRTVMNKGYYKKSAYVRLWFHILLKANHEKAEFFWNGKNQLVARGQFLTGRKQLSEETGIKEGTIENILKVLESEQQIEQQKTNKFRLITVKNYSKFQKVEQQSEQQSDNKVTTECQQNDTNNNNNNIKNNKNEKKRGVFTPPTFEEVNNYCLERSNQVDGNRFIDFYSSKGWMVGKNKMRDWKASIRNWERGDKKQNIKPLNTNLSKYDKLN